jgi:shikimate kinase
VSAGGESGGPSHLILIGLPGAGKTTHGRRVAKDLARPFIDLDRRVAHLAGKTVTRIFREDGEEAFRELERKATAALAIEPPSVVSPGGGWMLDASNVELVKPASLIVWLQVTPPVAVERMGARIRLRPLLATGDPVAKLTELLGRRSPRYAKADAVIDTEALDWQGVADAIAALVPPPIAR